MDAGCRNHDHGLSIPTVMNARREHFIYPNSYKHPNTLNYEYIPWLHTFDLNL